MKEQPILFNTEMVRAVLAGCKTQTRRPVKKIPLDFIFINGEIVSQMCGGTAGHTVKCPYGKIGDKLWVREAFYPQDVNGMTDTYALYRADNPEHHEGPWKPSIHMPRWASRITLEVVDVRVERVQDISNYDLRREGVDLSYPSGVNSLDVEGFYHARFASLWESVYKNKGSGWLLNPWVWVVEFKVI